MKNYKLLFIVPVLWTLCALTPAFSMEPTESTIHPRGKSQKLYSFHDLDIKDGSLLLTGISHTLSTDRIKVSAAGSTPEMNKKNQVFLRKIKEKYGETIYSLLEGAHKPGITRTENNLHTFFETQNQKNIRIVPLSIIGQHKQEQTRQKLRELGYDFEMWNKNLVPFPDVELGQFIYLNGFIYTKNSRDHDGLKGPTVRMLLEALKEKGQLPTSVIFVDDKEKLADNVLEANPNPPVPLLSYHYVWKRFHSPPVIKAFYQDILGGQFTPYESLFDEVFNAEQ